MPEFVKNHKAALFLMLFVAIIYGGHHLFIWSHLASLGQDYHPILINGDEALLNAPKAEAARLGKFIVGDFNVFEYKDRLIYVTPFLSPLVMGWLAKITGSVETAFIAGDFIFPSAIFLIFYLILFETTGKKLLSLVGSVFYIFLPRLASFMPPALKYLQAAAITMMFKTRGLTFSRIEDTQVTVPIYLLLLYFAIRSITRNDRISPWLAAFFYGLTFYSYFYYWTYFSAAMAFVLVLFLAKKDFLSFKRMLVIFSGGLLVSIPHWINSFNLSRLAHFQDIFERHGPEIGRYVNFEMLPSFAYALHFLLIAILFYFRKFYPKISYLLISLLMPIFLVYNLQLITGFNAQPDHWFKPTLPILYIAFAAIACWIFARFRRLFAPNSIIIAAIALSGALITKAVITEANSVKFTAVLTALFMLTTALAMFLNKKYRPASPYLAWNVLGVILIAGVLANGAYAQYKFVEEYKDVTIPSGEMASYRWLNENTPKYSVLGSSSFSTISRVQLYTHNKVFTPNGYSTIASNEEIWDRFFFINKIYGITPEKFEIIISSGDAGGFNKSAAGANDLYPFFKPDLDQSAAYYLFHMRYHNTKPGSSFISEVPLGIPKETQAQKSSEYSAFLNEKLAQLPYRLDYLYFGPREQKLNADPNSVFGGTLKKIYDHNGVVIYKMPE